MLLTAIKSGKHVRIKAINAGRGLISRLEGMGLVPGIELEVIQNYSHGPLIVQVHNARLILGQGMASSIMVE